MASAGGILGWASLRPFGSRAATVGGVVGAANGAIGAARRVYDLSRPVGVAAFVLDSTWAIGTTGASLVVHAVHAVLPGRGGFRADLSEGRNRHVYSTGIRLRRGFAMAIGPVITNAAGTRGLDPATPAGRRRRRFVDAHEGLHVWQQRWFGPLFPAVYAIWLVGGAVVGTVAYVRDRRDRWFSLVETVAYYDNPFEVWAYRNDGNWPPAGAHRRLLWRGSPDPAPVSAAVASE